MPDQNTRGSRANAATAQSAKLGPRRRAPMPWTQAAAIPTAIALGSRSARGEVPKTAVQKCMKR